MHGTLNWQQLQLLISRSTTPDLFKMQLKLEEFFNQQFKSSKRVFSNLYTSYTANAGTVPPKPGKTRKEGCLVIFYLLFADIIDIYISRVKKRYLVCDIFNNFSIKQFLSHSQNNISYLRSEWFNLWLFAKVCHFLCPQLFVRCR